MSSDLRLQGEREELDAATVRISGERFHYLARVRRVVVGDVVEIFDGAGWSRLYGVASVTESVVRLDAKEPPRVSVVSHRVVSILPLIKGDRMDWAISKVSELGATEIVVVRCARAVVTLSGERAHRRVERFERIAADASRQCGRSDVPSIEPITSLGEGLERVSDVGLKLVFDPRAAQGLREHLTGDVGGGGIAVLTGPEGGLTEEEIELARDGGFEALSLGPRTLRAETAAVVALSASLAIVGDVGGSV